MPMETTSFSPVTNERGNVTFEKSDLDISFSPEKPFNACLSCRYFRHGCSGPNVLLMTPERIGEFFRAVQSIYKISNAQISRDTGVSPSSVQRLLSGTEKDPRMSTLQAVSAYLVGDPHGKHACATYITEAEHSRTAEALAAARLELSTRETEITRLTAQLRDSRAAHAADAKLKDRYIGITVALLSASLIVNIVLAFLL